MSNNESGGATTDRRTFIVGAGSLTVLDILPEFEWLDDDVESAIVAVDEADERAEYDSDDYDVFLASDSGRVYKPDEDDGGWALIKSTGPNPVLDNVVIDNLRTKKIGVSANQSQDMTVASGEANESKLALDDVDPPFFDDFGELDADQNEVVLEHGSHHEIVAHSFLQDAKSGGQLNLQIKVNGTVRAHAQSTASNGNDLTTSASVYLKLDGGDVVTATVWHNTGSTETFPGDDGNYLSVIRQ